MMTAFAKRKARLHALAGFRRARTKTAGASGAGMPAGLSSDQANDRRLSLGLWAVLACQFGGAFNDHFFKMLVSLAAIQAGSGDGGGSAYLSLSGVIYVLPFLLFSGFAGYLTDRFDKRLVMIATKGFEIVLGALALVGLMVGSIELMLLVLFLFAAQSAFFSPPKYGILPEIATPQVLPRANGLVEFSRYVAIIGGTAVAGILSTLWGRESLGMGLVIIVVALLGWTASFSIPAAGKRLDGTGAQRRPASGSLGGIKLILANPKLRILVSIATALDFAMTLLSLVVLLLAKESMGLSDLESGLLVALAGVGVAFGSILAGHLSRGRAELGFLPLGAAGASAGLIMLSNSTASFAMAATALALMGAFTGFIVVPLYTALQRTAPPGERGRVIGANNFFNMFGVLIGSGLLWVLHDGLDLAPTRILAILALGILALTVATLVRSSRLRTRVSLLAAAALDCLHQVLSFGVTRVRHLLALPVRRSARRN
jgi:acyl-[acyl-carrier-protein]-phospholipid O-acyltransferase/long-chain-fatty-acid--[acyl-carrier-protein] ligase